MSMAVHAESDLSPFRQSSSGGTQQSETQLSVLQASTSRNVELSVVTAEGDRVTLTASASSESTLADYRHLGGNTKYSEHSSSRELTFSVEGDLSREELKDLKKVFSAFKKIIKKFFQGDLGGALHKADKGIARFAKSDSLASFDLALDYQRSVSVTQLSERTSSSTAEVQASPIDALPAGVDEASESDTVPPALVDTNAHAPTVEDEAVVPEESQPVIAAADPSGYDKNAFRSLVKVLQKTLQHSGFDSNRSAKLLPKLLARAIDDLKREPALVKEAPSLDSVKEQLLETLEKPSNVSSVHEVQQYQASSIYQTSLRLSAFV